MRYWILPAILCWAAVVSMTAPAEVLRDDPFQDQMTSAILIGISWFLLFGIVQKAIRARGLINLSVRVPFRALQREPPAINLNDRLLVDEQIQAVVGATRAGNEGDASAASSGGVRRLYEVLDE